MLDWPYESVAPASLVRRGRRASAARSRGLAPKARLDLKESNSAVTAFWGARVEDRCKWIKSTTIRRNVSDDDRDGGLDRQRSTRALDLTQDRRLIVGARFEVAFLLLCHRVRLVNESSFRILKTMLVNDRGTSRKARTGIPGHDPRHQSGRVAIVGAVPLMGLALATAFRTPWR
jgi:hypothetical protein